MKGKPVHFLAVTVAALLALAAPASATHVQCEDVISETTVLDSDLVCPTTEGDTGYVALTIGASDVTLWMNRHTIRSQSGYGTGVYVPASGLRNIQIRNGHFEGWSPAIHMEASDSAVMKVTASEPGSWRGAQIFMRGDRNYLHRNRVEGLPTPFPKPVDEEELATIGIQTNGDDTYTWGNAISGAGGIWSSGDRPRHVLNTIEGCFESSTGIVVGGYTNGAVINRNVVFGCIEGINAGAPGGRALIRLNQVNANDIGLWVTDSRAIVGRNVASGNTDYGIVSIQAGTTIQNNTANNNGFQGIYAVSGTVDGGGNTATGNGDGTTPQCENVQCSSP